MLAFVTFSALFQVCFGHELTPGRVARMIARFAGQDGATWIRSVENAIRQERPVSPKVASRVRDSLTPNWARETIGSIFDLDGENPPRAAHPWLYFLRQLHPENPIREVFPFTLAQIERVSVLEAEVLRPIREEVRARTPTKIDLDVMPEILWRHMQGSELASLWFSGEEQQRLNEGRMGVLELAIKTSLRAMLFLAYCVDVDVFGDGPHGGAVEKLLPHERPLLAGEERTYPGLVSPMERFFDHLEARVGDAAPESEAINRAKFIQLLGEHEIFRTKRGERMDDDDVKRQYFKWRAGAHRPNEKKMLRLWQSLLGEDLDPLDLKLFLAIAWGMQTWVNELYSTKLMVVADDDVHPDAVDVLGSDSERPWKASLVLRQFAHHRRFADVVEDQYRIWHDRKLGDEAGDLS